MIYTTHIPKRERKRALRDVYALELVAPKFNLWFVSVAPELAGAVFGLSGACLAGYVFATSQPAVNSLPENSIGSWDDLEEAFLDNFQGTYVRPPDADDLSHIVQ